MSCDLECCVMWLAQVIDCVIALRDRHHTDPEARNLHNFDWLVEACKRVKWKAVCCSSV